MDNRTRLQSTLTDHELGRSIHVVNSLIRRASLDVGDFLKYVINGAREAGEGNYVVLDVGCGLGHALANLSQILGNIADVRAKLELIGVDINPLKSSKIELPNNVHLFSCDAAKMLVPSNHVDVGFSVASMQYFDDALRALEEGYRVLKPGGKFFWLINGSSDVSLYPHLRTILTETPGASEVFSWQFGEDDDHSLIVCKKSEDDQFHGFPFRKRFSTPALFPLRKADFHKRRTVYKRFD